MITTLTLNPSLDRTTQVSELRPGEIHRNPPASIEAAGKGVNVARALQTGGVASIAVVACGVSAAPDFVSRLEASGLAVRFVDTGQPVRSNVSIIEDDGRTTKLNEPGFPLSADAGKDAIDAICDLADRSDWVVASGSLPPDAPMDFYADLAQRLDGAAVRLAVDTSGPALAAMVGAPCALLKPNRSELASLTNADPATIGDAVDAARELIEQGTGAVLASLGSDGAVLVTKERALHAVAATMEMSNTVGAGDSLLAGFLAGGGVDENALREGMAWARAALRSKTTEMAKPTDDDRMAVVITDVSDPGSDHSAALLPKPLEDRT